MIFYFTATGNSLYIAKQLDENPVSIAQELKKDELHYEADEIGIVVPDYGGELPQIVRRFLKKAVFDTPYLYMVITYGKNASIVSEWSYYFGKMNGVHFDYIHSIKMVDNYLPVFDMKEEKALDKHIPEQLARIREDLKAHRSSIEHPVDEDARKLYDMASRRPKEMNDGSKIHIQEEKCAGCGMCSLVCPIGNIHLEDGKAKRKAQVCEYCLACVHHCCTKAIIIEGEKNPAERYRNAQVRVSEIMLANQQS